MTDVDRFETRFESWIQARADIAVRPTDAGAIARTAIGATGRQRRGWHGLLTGSPGARTARLVLVLLLTAVLVGVGALVGSQLLRPTPTLPIPPERGVFTPTGSLPVATWGAQPVLLPDGRVALVGGLADDATSTIQVYDPTTGAFTQAAGLPSRNRVSGHSATVLRDGRVLIVGGERVPVDGSDPETTTEADLWDPVTGTLTPTGSMGTARAYHAALQLHDGRVLVAGGPGDAEIWDPNSGVFLPAGWSDPTMAVRGLVDLGDGRVLVIALSTGRDQVLPWDPMTNTLGPATAMPSGRTPVSGALLADGRVAVVSGCDTLVQASTARTVCVDTWDPTTGALTSAGVLTSASFGPAVSRFPSVTPLRDGRILVLSSPGGAVEAGCVLPCPTRGAEIWDPTTGEFAPTASMTTARRGLTATLLRDGRVLVVGGGDDKTAELFVLR
jgi:WD40 repeat protein